MEIRPHNPKLLLLDGNGKPIPFAHILFYNEGTDVPAGVYVEDTGVTTSFVVADDSGFFPSVVLQKKKYTLRSFVPMEGVESPSFPEDFVAYESWNLDGGEEAEDIETAIAELTSLDELRALSTAEYSSADVNGVRYVLANNSFNDTDDGGYAIAPTDDNTKIWFAQLSGNLLPVTLWGADPTGTEDSSSAISSAFACVSRYSARASSIPCPSVVFFPNGIFSISENVNATAPVEVSSETHFYNSTDSALEFVIYSSYKFRGSDLLRTGTAPVHIRYSVNAPHYVDGGLEGGEIEGRFVGGYAEVFSPLISNKDGISRTIARAIVPSAGLAIEAQGVGALTINEFDFSSGGTLDLGGVDNVLTTSTEIRTSYLANPVRDLLKINGKRLVIDTAIAINTNTELKFDEVYVATGGSLSSAYPSATLNFSCRGHIVGEASTIHIKGLILGRAPSAHAIDWTGCGSAEFTAYVNACNGDADFEEVTITADIALPVPAILRNFKITGSLTSSNSLMLYGGYVSNGVACKTLHAENSTFGYISNACDIELVGCAVLNNLSFVSDGTQTDIDVRIYRTNLQGYLNFTTANPLARLVVRECSTAHSCFIAKNVGGVITPTYNPIVYDWSSSARVCIDISDNTTTDTSTQPLLRSRGISALDGTAQSGVYYLTKLKSMGFVDFFKPSGTESRIADAIFTHFSVGNNVPSGPLAYTTDGDGDAVVAKSVSGLCDAVLDPWNTQTNW